MFACKQQYSVCKLSFHLGRRNRAIKEAPELTAHMLFCSNAWGGYDIRKGGEVTPAIT